MNLPLTLPEGRFGVRLVELRATHVVLDLYVADRDGKEMAVVTRTLMRQESVEMAVVEMKVVLSLDQINF